MNGIVVGGVLVYLACVLGVGVWAGKKIHNLADFLVAGRQLPYHLAVATLIATWFGAGSCMGASGTAYAKGLIGVIADPFAAGLSLIIAGTFYVAWLRRLELLTVTDIFGRYYGQKCEIFASVLMVPVYISWLGAQMVALGYLMNSLLGIDPHTGIMIGACFVVTYTLVGGMWAVSIMDFIQIVVVFAGLAAIYPVVLKEVGGFQRLLQMTPPEFLRLTPRNPGFEDWVAYVGQWTMMGLGCVVGQDLIQRALSSKNEKVAKQSAITAGLCYMTIGIIPVTLGLAGRIIMPGLENPENIMPFLALEFLPPVLLVVFLGALISAIMSSADSSLLAATSLATHNILFRIYPKIDQRHLLSLTRLMTVLIAFLSLGIALYIKQIYNLMVNSWATLFVAIFVPVTAALYWKKANAPAAWVSMIAGTLIWMGYIIVKTGTFQNVAEPVFYCASVYGALTSLFSYVSVTWMRYGKIPDGVPASKFPAGVKA